MKKEVRKPYTHLADEFFVSAELSKMGINVALTMGNAKKVDLIIENESKTIPIQVKALASRKNVGWPINREHKYPKSLIFVLVILGPLDRGPEYYILPGNVVTAKAKHYGGGRSILNISSVAKYKDNWKLIEQRLKK